MSGLNQITSPDDYHRMRWAILGAQFPQLRHFIELSLDANCTEEELVEYGQRNNIQKLIDTVLGVENGFLPPEALDEFRSPKKEEE